MENTIEQKQRFIAQYFGTPAIWRSTECGQEELVWDKKNFFQIDETDYLELKPLSAISDEDAIKVARMFIKSEETKDELLYCGRIFTTCMFDSEDRETGLYNKHCQAVDYLRSKGYALPYQNLSVEQQISYGWVKLKTT